MSIDLTALSFGSAGPQPLRMGGTTRGPLGGSQTINRLGDRWMMAVETRAYHVEPDGRLLSTMIEQALREGAILRVKQPSFTPMISGTPVTDGAVLAGKSIPLAGMQPGSVIRYGQFVSIIVDGQRYLDKVTQEVSASPAGTATLSLMNLIRRPLPAGAAVELAARIEGTIDSFSGGTWAKNRTTSWAFTVMEDE
jgi:hypothetical protein